jgi:hypothetical protein
MKRKYFFLVSKMKKWIKKLCTLKQNHYCSRKNECSFFKSILRSRFHFFRSLTFDSSLVLILLSCSFKSYWIAICFVFVLKFARFVSVDSSRAAAFLHFVVEHRDPPKVKPFVAVPVIVPTDSAHT